jgi:AcrR family transcriptional regulator
MMANETAQSVAPTKPKRHLRRWKRRKNARPVEILAAVKAAVAEHGIENVRMGDIANRANVSKGTLYCYFSNKAELLAFVGTESSPQEHEASPVLSSR